jgi:7,8-dihydro-6-hydroxymethylpterin-pyrophosphokinase
MEQAVIVFGLGSNKGDSRSIITCAVKRLGEYIHGMRRASFYETEPLLELFPGAVDPLTGCPYQTFFNTLPDQRIQKLE